MERKSKAHADLDRRLLELEDGWRALVRTWRERADAVESEGNSAQVYRASAFHTEICADDLRAVREAQSARGETS